MLRISSGPCALKSLSHAEAAFLAAGGLAPGNDLRFSGASAGVLIGEILRVARIVLPMIRREKFNFH
jgi:hypothetical protein